MTVQDDISNAMRTVISTLGTGWSVRVLTSAYDAQARTYGSPEAITAHMVNETDSQEADEIRGGYIRRRLATLKVSDATVYNIGDQFISPENTTWHCDGRLDASAIDGITRYTISRDKALKGAATERGGKV